MRHHRHLTRLAVACLFALGGASGVQAGTFTPKPEIFAPGVISGPANDASATFSPDGRTVYFFRSNGADYDIMTSHLDGKRWSPPRAASFSGRWRDLEPTMSPDGRYLIFASSRPVDGSGKALDGHWHGKLHAGSGGNLWRVDRRGDRWSSARHLPATVNRFDSVFSPAIARDGTLYFMAATGEHGHFRLYRTPYVHGHYGTPRPLPFSTGRWSDMDAAVAPDQSFIVFASTRPPTPARKAEVFIAFRQGTRWSQPQPVNATINALATIIELRLGPDGHTLYLTSSHVVPPSYPKTISANATSQRRMQSWNDGNANIWKVDLAPLLPALRAQAVWAAISRPVPPSNE